MSCWVQSEQAKTGGLGDDDPRLVGQGIADGFDVDVVGRCFPPQWQM